MTLAEQLHRSKAHRKGFDPNCPRCLQDKGIDGVIKHLEECAREQRRTAGILRMLKKWGRKEGE